MKRIMLSMCFAALIFSCSNDDDSNCIHGNTTIEEAASFFALKTGNSWVYKNYLYNATTEAYEYSGVIDSVKIIGTELVNDNLYYKFRTRTSGNDVPNSILNPNGEYTELLRDSLGYLVNHSGTTIFTNNDFTEQTVQAYSWGTTYLTLQEDFVDLTVEAGTFNCLNSHLYARTNPDNVLTPALDNIYYSEGIGLIHESRSFLSSNIQGAQRRLDSYIIQ